MNTEWESSTYSSNGANCVQTKLVWKTSSASGAQGNCVAVAVTDEREVWLRDSKLGDASPILKFTPDEWDAFERGVLDGEFSL